LPKNVNATRVTDRTQRIKLEAYKKSGLNTAGKPLIRKMKLEKSQKKQKKVNL
jgi:hypothetical protein